MIQKGVYWKMSDKNIIRWGIIGCGDVTEVKSGPGLQLARGSSLVAVMRRDAAKAQDYARRHQVPRWYADADKLMDDPEVDAVYVATPPDTHEHYAMRALERGKPCYVEKPMARNFAEAARMTAAFAAASVPLFVAFYRRGLPRFLKAKELVQTGKLGTVSSVSVRYAGPRWKEADTMKWRLDAKSAGAGYFLDLASHTLDLLDFILGPLEGVAGHAVNVATPVDVEDNVAMVFRTPGNVLGTAYWNFAASLLEDVIEISGTLGRVSLSTFGNEAVKLVTEAGVEEFALPNPPHVQGPLIQTVVDELLGRGVCRSKGASAMRTNAVMDKVLEGYYGGREDGFWERPWPGRRI
jgi:predicted dehydrogenase